MVLQLVETSRQAGIVKTSQARSNFIAKQKNKNPAEDFCYGDLDGVVVVVVV
jgi:hypothetical protein